MLGEIEPYSLFLFQIFIDPTVKYKVQELYVYMCLLFIYLLQLWGTYRRLFHLFFRLHFLLYGQF